MKLSYNAKHTLKWAGWLIFLLIISYFYFRYPFYKLFTNILLGFSIWILGFISLIAIIIPVARKFKQWWRGMNAEMDVEDVSYDLPRRFKILRNIVLGKMGNIDEIIVGPTGIWLIEVKSHRGKITFDGKELRRDGDVLEKDFLKQVWDQTNKVRGILENKLERRFFVNPVICFSDAELRFGFKPIRGVYVIGLNWLKKLVLKSPIRLDESSIDRIVRELKK